jgi:hypothetical protein
MAGEPGTTITILVCECGDPTHQWAAMDRDFIKRMGDAHKAGWRRRLGKWYVGDCTPASGAADE